MLFFKDNEGREKKVFFKHMYETIPADPRKENSQPHRRPRHTACSIVDGEEVVGHNIASCCPTDAFSYSEGRKTALTRALQDAGLSREDRKLAWAAYHEKNK